VQKSINYPENGQCRNPGFFHDNYVRISPLLSCKLMGAGDGTASSVCLQAAGPPGLSSCPSCRAQPQRWLLGTSGASPGALCEANCWITAVKAGSDRSPKCLCKKIQPGRPCKLTQGAGRKSSAHRDQHGQISPLQGEIKLPVYALIMFWHQCQDHGGPLSQCVHEAGLVHPFLDRSILNPKSLPWLLDPKAGNDSTRIFWPRSPL